MLDTFHIENFRLFREMDTSRLRRVNLLVGKNNCGKSAFLEAIAVYASNASVTILRDLLVDREETWNERKVPGDNQGADIAIRHLFRGHMMPPPGSPGIVLGPDGQNHIHLLTGVYELITDEDGSTRRRLLAGPEMADAADDERLEFAVICKSGDKTRRIFGVKPQFVSSRSARIAPGHESNYPLQIVPTRNMTPESVATLWDAIGLTPAADQVLDALRMIEPSITGIQFVGREARIPLVKCSNVAEPLPLKSMGEGMTRLFHIIVALVCARDGIVLIDEFENGLHWSVQSKVWETLFHLAMRLNVQVFATTHSRDCIAGFKHAWVQDPAAGAFHRLQLDPYGSPNARAYSLETLEDSLDTDVEVR